MIGAFNSPFDFNYFIQNFTEIEYGVLVDPTEQTSIAYRMNPSPNLDPMPFQLAAVVFYTVDDELYSTTVFNSTVELYEPKSDFDAKQMFTYFAVTAIIALVVLVVMRYISDDKKRSKYGDNEWLAGTAVQLGTSNTQRAVKK